MICSVNLYCIYCVDAAVIVPDQFVLERARQLKEIADMSMYNNGDMVRPQVKAVIDLLVAGIVIEADFTNGYDSLQQSTEKKAQVTLAEVADFVDELLSNPSKNSSIPAAVAAIQARVDQRRSEVDALLEAANAHLIADHSHMDVLTKAADKDIDDWVVLTKQLIENSFKDAESRFLSSLFPTPPTSPRPDVLPEEYDRVGVSDQGLAQGSSGRHHSKTKEQAQVHRHQ